MEDAPDHLKEKTAEKTKAPKIVNEGPLAARSQKTGREKRDSEKVTDHDRIMGGQGKIAERMKVQKDLRNDPSVVRFLRNGLKQS